ncbi:MAG: DUF2059 domain-containing protein [Rhodoferax sp.]|nr:DUF2059 domain-containing protein [Rhodoferax sp.]
MKRYVLTLALVVASFLAHAAAPSARSIDKLLALTQAEKLMDSIRPQVRASMQAGINQALQGRRPNEEEQKVLDNFLAKAIKAMDETLTMETMKPLYLQLYTQYFTQKEVDGLIAFYQSAAGKSMVTKMPQLMQGLMGAMPALMAPMLEQIQAAAVQMNEELQALQK